MKLHPFYHFLQQSAGSGLPGRDAQMKMSPIPLDPDFVLPRDPSGTAHPSGVLIPLFPDRNEQLSVVLTLRTGNIRHAGQISFPGGRREGEETLEQTALRETEEEIGIKPDHVILAGSITPLYLYRTDNQITPYVGFLRDKPELKPNPDEVEEAFTVSLDDLISGKYFKREEWHLNHTSFDVPFWSVHQVPLWGATAMMLNELLEIYKIFKKS
jgi:8-oxo-dGTP pyrophosphatase MutT (NUDIX family)